MRILEEDFYRRDTVQVARELLGKILIHESKEGLTSGIIVETEAYYQGDPACHATRGRTKRNAVMFGPAGIAYVYFVYGKHHCFNVVTGEEGSGEAVLVRALEPLEGVELMKRRRGDKCPYRRLSSGPGNLCSAMGIKGEHSGVSLLVAPLYICNDGDEVASADILVTSRVGISRGEELLLRFYIKNNPYVSRR